MNAIVIIVAGLILASKVLDCWSTWIRIKGIENEQNPIARGVMSVIGIGPAILIILLIEIVLVLFAAWILFEYFDQLVSKLLFVVVGLLVTVMQVAAAHANYLGRPNQLTMVAAKAFRRIFV
jgi:hypothetical protein